MGVGQSGDAKIVVMSPSIRPMLVNTWKVDMSNPLELCAIIVVRSVWTERSWEITSISIIETKTNKAGNPRDLYLLERCSETINKLLLLDLETYIFSKMSKLTSNSETYWRCNDCGYESKKKTNTQEHVEARHIESSGFLCTICQHLCPNRKALRNHTFRHHRLWFWNCIPSYIE